MSKREEGGTAAAKPVYREFDHHPLLKLFPTGSEEDISAMHRSVAEKGVQQKIRVWKDPKGKTHLIDGTVRQAGAKRAFLEKTEADPPLPPVAANGLDIQPEYEEFFGTPDEVYQFIKTTHVRKHYTPGQKAALGTQLYYFEYKKAHGNKLPDPQIEVTGEGALTARELALLYGVNEYYIRICRQLYREAPDLFEAVAMGVTPPPKAKAELERRKAGNVPGAPGEEDGDGTDAKDVGKDAGEVADQMEDAEGNAVPDNQVDAFKTRAVFKQLRRELTKLKGQAGSLAASDGGSYLDQKGLDAQFAALIAHLSGAEPQVVCPVCGGKGHKPGKRHACDHCDQVGYLSRTAHANAKRAATKGGGKGDDEQER